MKIRITKQADEEFTYDGEDEASIRQALLHERGVPGIVYDITDMDRSDMDADEYLTVTEDDGTPLWSGWLGGVTAPPPADRAALEQLAAAQARITELEAQIADSGAEHPSCDAHRWWAVVQHYGSFAYGFAATQDGLRMWSDVDEFEYAKAQDFE